MKEKILAALKTAYAKLGLSDKAFDGVASLLEKTVTDEAQIATAISGDEVKALLTAIQGQVDSLRNKLSDKEKELNDYKEAHPETTPPATPPATPPTETEPEWAKTLRQSVETLANAQAARDKADKAAADLASVKEKLKAKLGAVHDGLFDLTLVGFALGDKETIDDAVTRLETAYNANIKKVFGDGPIPSLGNGIKPGGGEYKPGMFKELHDTLVGRGEIAEEPAK